MIDGLGSDVTEINFVGHSLGNIILRNYLHQTTDQATGLQGDQRIGRIVMLGPPNRGSRMARMMSNSFLFNVVAGATGGELSTSWEEFEKTLAVPAAEFGIIAGGQDEGRLSNPMLSGQDDFTVSVEEATLDGADDLFVWPLFHSTMMNQPEVHQATLNFLSNGYFVSEEERVRIPDPEPEPGDG